MKHSKSQFKLIERKSSTLHQKNQIKVLFNNWIEGLQSILENQPENEDSLVKTDKSKNIFLK